MKYRAFGDYRKGYAHVKNGSGVEDYADSYNDPQGRYYIGVICDGHSDKNCFRSGAGARFGCESAIEILKRFFELYYAQNPEERKIPEAGMERLKRSIKLSWDRKVMADIQAHPLEEENLQLLTDRVRKIYESGQGLLNIYGATFLAVALCEDFFLAMHIGDGAVLCADADGNYYNPMPLDAKSETGAPASLCDTDLFTRENAFRIVITEKLPMLATVSSDGIEDCMDALEYKRLTGSLLRRLQNDEAEGQASGELNEKQKRYFGSCLEYYADKGHGAEDDCSLAVIYKLDEPVPEIRIPHEEALRTWNQIVVERNEMVRDYDRRKKSLVESMQQLIKSPHFRGGVSVEMHQWIEAHEKLEEQKQTLRTIVNNEKDKLAAYTRQMDLYYKFIKMEITAPENLMTIRKAVEVDSIYLEADDDYAVLKNYWQESTQKQQWVRKLELELEQASNAVDTAYDEAKRIAKMQPDADVTVVEQSIKIAREQYQKLKDTYEAAIKDAEAIQEKYRNIKNDYFTKNAYRYSGVQHVDTKNQVLQTYDDSIKEDLKKNGSPVQGNDHPHQGVKQEPDPKKGNKKGFKLDFPWFWL